MAVHRRFLETYEALPPAAATAVDIVLVLVGGYIVLWLLRRYAIQALGASRLDATLVGFLRALITTGGWLFLVVAALAVAGIQAAALLGGLAIGGFILGFALKDSLGNLAAGVVLLLYRPFQVGEVVTIQGHSGGVQRLGVAFTWLKAADGRLITVPNGTVLGGAVVNHTREPIRRADVLVGISYGDDIDAAVRAILGALRADARVLAEPEPSVRITGLGDSSVDLEVRPWVRTPDIWQAKADLHATVKRALEDAGCTIPFPQRDIHVIEAN